MGRELLSDKERIVLEEIKSKGIACAADCRKALGSEHSWHYVKPLIAKGLVRHIGRNQYQYAQT
jgi:hypothetical protein